MTPSEVGMEGEEEKEADKQVNKEKIIKSRKESVL